MATELTWLVQLPPQQRSGALTTIFSAKETTFKCLYGLTRLMFGFDAVRIDLDLASGTFRALVQHPLPPFPVGHLLQGRIGSDADHVVTIMTIPESSAMAERPHRDLVREQLEERHD